MDPVEYEFLKLLYSFYVRWNEWLGNFERMEDHEDELENLLASPPLIRPSSADRDKAWQKFCQRLTTIEATASWNSEKVYAYPLSTDAYQSLRWLSDRYDSAQLFWEYGYYAGEDIDGAITCPVIFLTENEIKAIYEATLGDGGNPGVIPCAGPPIMDAANHFFSKVNYA